MFLIHARYFLKHFCLALVHTWHSNAGIDGPRDKPAGGGNAKPMDASGHETEQKKKMARGKEKISLSANKKNGVDMLSNGNLTALIHNTATPAVFQKCC